ncbi:MAG TPA: nitroreductase family protein [Candidatus Paceibacterota bacterium]
MDIMEDIFCRRSVRKYENKPILDDDIFETIKAVSFAPSGKNNQPWSFLITSNKDDINMISNCSICSE